MIPIPCRGSWLRRQVVFALSWPPSFLAECWVTQGQFWSFLWGLMVSQQQR